MEEIESIHIEKLEVIFLPTLIKVAFNLKFLKVMISNQI